MTETVDRIVDQAWESLLASILKKRGKLRAEMGDEVDLYIPQSRLLSLVASDPAAARLLYAAAQSSARRNAFAIVRKLGMPADYFWKFEYWPKGRALAALEKIVSRVFSSMMSQAKAGNLKVVDLDVDPIRIGISFSDCVECAGIGGFKQGICYYHAGAMSGIISGLINQELDAIETACTACGDKSCDFTVGDRADKDIKARFESFITPPEVGADLVARMEKSLRNLPVRSLFGNLVDVNYLQLAIASTLLADPKRFAATNFQVGSGLGRKLAPVLAQFCQQKGIQSLCECYRQLGEFCIEVRASESKTELEVKECAESVGNIKAIEMVSFLCGELQGLASELTKSEVVIKESRLEGDKLIVTLTPKA